MSTYQKILFVSTGVSDEKNALTQALTLTKKYHSELTVLIIHPQFPSHLAVQEKQYEQSLIDNLQTTIDHICRHIDLAVDQLKLVIKVEKQIKPTIAIIRQVLTDSIDLVIKQSEQEKSKNGFKALDMDLLRQCPCPLWLCRPITKQQQYINIAVAVDAQIEHEEGHNLSLQLLKTADDLANDCHINLAIISCWDYELEEYFKGNPWMNFSDTDILDQIKATKETNFTHLTTLIEQSNITNTHKVHNLKGQPEKCIAQFVEENDIDILVMGTVARTGLAGFIIGNTAENILQKIACSVVALKPHGFVSPVKAY